MTEMDNYDMSNYLYMIIWFAEFAYVRHPKYYNNYIHYNLQPAYDSDTH